MNKNFDVNYSKYIQKLYKNKIPNYLMIITKFHISIVF